MIGGSMFLYNFDKEIVNIFEDNSSPKAIWLSHSHDNPNWTYNYHLHKCETELVYILNGMGIYSINNEIYTVKKGDVLVIDRGCIHSIASNNEFAIDAWTCGVTDYTIKDINEVNQLLHMDTNPVAQAGKHGEFIHRSMVEMNLARIQKSPYTSCVCNMIASTLITIYYDIFKDSSKIKAQKKSSFIRDIIIYINENYSKHISLKKLSEQFHISSYHISHEFKKIYGISPINYVIERRLSDAKWLLINTQDSLISIANKVGYENPNHFTNLFMERTNYSPLQYRENFAKSTDLPE
jgi:AraC-like DNA-binding protein/mannose-6-phosphate isomerase-like protein (cupin superfamily)